MAASGIVDVRNVMCPRCGGFETRVVIRTSTSVLSRCYGCADESVTRTRPDAMGSKPPRAA